MHNVIAAKDPEDLLEQSPHFAAERNILEFTRLFRITEISIQTTQLSKSALSIVPCCLTNNVRMLILYIIAETCTQVDEIRNAYFSKAGCTLYPSNPQLC